MNLKQFFRIPPEAFVKSTPRSGERTEWLEFCSLKLKGPQVLIIDAQFAQSSKEGFLVDLKPGVYQVQVEVANFGGDRRISRMRLLFKAARPTRGKKIGKTWTDTGTTGVCDLETFSQAWNQDPRKSSRILASALESEADFGIAALTARKAAILPFVQSGFGDGQFPVFELMQRGQRVGCEIEFIATNKKYPFGKTPFEQQTQALKLEARAEKGGAEDLWLIGKSYLEGDGVDRNVPKAMQWLTQAANHGHTEAAVTIAQLCLEGTEVTKDPRRAKALLESAAKGGSARASYLLGQLLWEGMGIPADRKQACTCYLEAANRGLPDAQVRIAQEFESGEVLPPNRAESARWFRAAADQGNRDGTFHLARCLLSGSGGAKDESEAVKLLLNGYQYGHAPSTFLLAQCFESGRGVETNFAKAAACYQSAALGEHPQAMRILGQLFKEGRAPMKQNLAFALKWFQRASEAGDAQAFYELGLMHEDGLGVPADKVEAQRMYRRAIKAGFR
ncbi:MAG: SEL1-like repeat protein [Verrucomicrobiales bacterium]|nr:SEL1-like repeat protein [Verrucomicrobiales bacterium]